MDEEIVERLASAFGFGRANDPPSDADAASGGSAGLYSCLACERVYIGGNGRSCGDCGSDLERVPSGRDLGIVADR